MKKRERKTEQLKLLLRLTELFRLDLLQALNERKRYTRALKRMK